MRLDLRRMSWPELANLLKDVAREIEIRGKHSSNPQYRDDRSFGNTFPSSGGGYNSAYSGQAPFRGPPGLRKKRFNRPRGPGGPDAPPPRDGDFNR